MKEKEREEREGGGELPIETGAVVFTGEDAFGRCAVGLLLGASEACQTCLLLLCATTFLFGLSSVAGGLGGLLRSACLCTKNPQTWILLSSRADNLCLQHTSQALHRYRLGSKSLSSLVLVVLVLFLLLLLLCWVCCFFFLSWREDRGSKVSFPIRFFLEDVKRR